MAKKARRHEALADAAWQAVKGPEGPTHTRMHSPLAVSCWSRLTWLKLQLWSMTTARYISSFQGATGSMEAIAIETRSSLVEQW